MVDPRPKVRAHLREVLLHRSVIDRIGDRASRYAPIVLPETFRILEPEGHVTANPETPAQSAARMAGQEQVWDDVWLRRMYYRLTLLTSLLLASLPFWGSGEKAQACETLTCAISPLFRALGYVVPAIGQYWTTAFADHPGVTLGLIILLLVLLDRASALQHRLRDRMNTLLDGLRPGAIVPGSPASPPAWVRRVRCARWTLGGAKTMKWKVWPAVTGALGLALLLLATPLLLAHVVSRHLIAHNEAAGGLCGVDVVKATDPFNTRYTCWDTKTDVDPDKTYRVKLWVIEPWFDDTILASPLGYANSEMTWLKGYWAAPSRRAINGGWFQPHVTIRMGDGPARVQPLAFIEEGGFFVARLSPAQRGHVYLWVNDAVAPLLSDADEYYRNNSGTAKVEITEIAEARP